MTSETFFEKFDLFADAPDAVEKMRELILQWSVRGLLVRQHSDESTKDQIARVLKFNSLRKRRNDELLASFPFQVPLNWSWIALGDAMHMVNGRAFKPSDWSTQGVPIIRIQNLNNERASFNFCAGDVEQRFHVIDGDFLISWSGTPGTSFGAFIWRRGFAYLNQHIFRCELAEEVYEKDFLRFAVNARLDEMISHAQGGVGLRHITKGKLESIQLPLPPLAEQKRIVAKVDELMALCDQFEAQQQEREARHAMLARASLSRFAETPTPANLDFLFHKSFDISPADLRKTILTLAVQGKLVPQDPNDEPTEECLRRLGLKNTLSLNEDDDSLPSSWSRVRFEDVALTTGGVTLGRKLGDRKTVTLPYLRVANVKRGEIDLCIIKEVSIAEDEIERYALRENDLLMTEGGDWDKVGRAAIWKGQIPICLHQNHVFRSRMRSNELSPVWFECYFNSPDGRRYFESASKQTTNLASINMRQVRGCPVPLPPLPEQRRIVAKVDELMSLVDKLESQLASARSISEKLLTAVVVELTNLEARPSHTIRPSIEPRVYLTQFVVALLAKVKRPIFLRELTQTVGLLFSHDELLTLAESVGGNPARRHFENFAQPNADGALAAALRLLKRAGAIAYRAQGHEHLVEFHAEKAPPVDSLIAQDGKYMAEILELISSDRIKPPADLSIQTARIERELLSVM